MPLFYLSVLSAAFLTIQLNTVLEAEKPAPPQAPFVPPFEGGQCSQNYFIELTMTLNNGEKYFFIWVGDNSNMRDRTTPYPVTFTSEPVLGSIRNVEIVSSQSSTGVTQLRINTSWGFVSKQFIHHPMAGFTVVTCQITRVRLQSGLSDSCGNTPNPNPPLDSIPNSGYGVPPSNIAGNPSLLYAPIIPVGGSILSAAAALSAALALLQAAATVAEIAARLADVLDKFNKLNEEKEKERRREEEKKRRKELFRQDLGRIQNDGMLSLVPNDTEETIELLFLDVNFISIPNTIGRYYGNFSPNRHLYSGGLGYISFYSYSFGIISSHQLEFRRNTLAIPNGTYGFFYHFGLNTSYQANTQLIYNREVLE